VVNVVIPQASKDQGAQFTSIDSSRSRQKKIGDMRGIMDIKKAEILDSIEDRYLVIPPPMNTTDYDYFHMTQTHEDSKK
jgi:hypothetical protein